MAVSARMISAGLLPLVMRKRATVERVMARFSEASSVNGLQPLHRDIARDLEHHLVLDEAGLGGWRYVHDSPVEAGRQLLLLPLLRTGRPLLLLPLLRTGRSRGLLLRRQSDSTLHGVEHRRPGRVERGELRRAVADKIVDDLHRTWQRCQQVERERRQWLGR
jgi:hypothetical protein